MLTKAEVIERLKDEIKEAEQRESEYGDALKDGLHHGLHFVQQLPDPPTWPKSELLGRIDAMLRVATPVDSARTALIGVRAFVVELPDPTQWQAEPSGEGWYFVDDERMLAPMYLYQDERGIWRVNEPSLCYGEPLNSRRVCPIERPTT